jgi:hypothetical protein
MKSKVSSAATQPKIQDAPQTAPTQQTLGGASTQILAGLEWLPKIMALHQAVRAEMPEAKRHVLIPKTEAYFRDLLTGKTGVVFGVVAQGKLVGFMNGVRCTSFGQAQAEGFLTCPDTDGSIAAAYGKGSVAVAQSLCVLNAFGGRGFSHALIRAFVVWGTHEKFTHLFAQIAQENAPSWMRFMSYDFAIVDGWIGGHKRFLLRWMSASEKAAQMGRATTSDLHSVNKDYAELPALLAVIGAMLPRGRIVMASGAEPSSTKLDLVFGQKRI